MLAHRMINAVTTEPPDHAGESISKRARNSSDNLFESPLLSPSKRYPRSILLVEDNSTNQIIVKGILERAGYEVTVTQNGHEAIGACRTQAFDIILMDIEMPHIDGIEATQFIRAHAGPNQISTIVALTAYGSASEKYTYKQSGIDHIITKPFTLEALTPVLEKQFGIAATLKPQCGYETPKPMTVIDPKILSQIAYDHNIAEVEYILRSFWRVASGLLSDIQNAQNAGNIDALRHAAHALKGAAANIGLREIAMYSSKLGSAPERKKLEIINDIERAMRRGRKALATFLEAMT